MLDWSREEVEATVADYLQMLTLELTGQRYNKSEHRKRLQHKLQGRTEAAIEFKHGNISAAMEDLGFMGIPGYRRRGNYQGLLATVVAAQIRDHATLDSAALAAVQMPAAVPSMTDFTKVKAEAPQKQSRAMEPVDPLLFRAVKRDYLEREAQNQSLGLAGEKFAVLFEHWRLVSIGEHKLADKVEHVSLSKGDGLGYDVLSFDAGGKERFIEVKTTTYGRDTPFFVSRRELALSRGANEQFQLYRVFEFRKTPRLFNLTGSLDVHCVLDPVTFRASFD
jgi:hypothetical protein